MKTFAAAGTILLSMATAVGSFVGWQTYNVGATGISIELPMKPEPMQLDVPEGMRNQVQSFENFLSATNDLAVIVSRMDYTSANPNLNGAADGAIQRLQLNPGFSAKRLERKPFKLGSLSAMYIYVEYSMQGGSLIHHQVLAIKGKTLWQVVVTYDATAAARGADAKRILDSIKIKG
ncbi:MAG: hypothetical protein KatS3mg015_0631 [Fimbriimonadales bacterium]|nr:MAG: hypothetical protein KatS3mg015_0631 [Fimbriimonadales bacterium]